MHICAWLFMDEHLGASSRGEHGRRDVRRVAAHRRYAGKHKSRLTISHHIFCVCSIWLAAGTIHSGMNLGKSTPLRFAGEAWRHLVDKPWTQAFRTSSTKRDARLVAADSGTLGDPRTLTAPTRRHHQAGHLLHQHLQGVPSRQDTVFTNTYTESPRGGTPSTPTSSRYAVHTDAGVVASDHNKVAST